MAETLKRQIIRRVEGRLKEMGISPRAASIEAGFGSDVIRDWKRKPKIMPRVDTIAALAPVLDVTPEWIAFGVPSNGAAVVGLPVHGEVAAGLWLEIDGATDAERFDPVPVTPDMNYPRDAQYGLVVKGTSINRVAKPGDILICLDLKLSGIEPIDGDLVIVERRRVQEGNREVTAKRLRRRAKKIELFPDSDDPQWQESAILDAAQAPEGEEVEIKAISRSVFRQVPRSPR